MQTRSRRRTTSTRGSQSGLSLTDLGPDLLESVLVHLDAGEFFKVATTCRAFAALCRLPVLWTGLPLGTSEDAAFPLERRHLLERLVEAGNPAANYRLGVALSYHPTADVTDNEHGRMLLRTLASQQSAPASLRADAAFECWLLTRRLPEPASPSSDDGRLSAILGGGGLFTQGDLFSGESLLDLAASLGHNPARFGKHRPRTRDREPTDFRVSSEYAIMQDCLRRARDLHAPNTATASMCKSPSCGRWGVRARARANGIMGPPALPRCQGMMPGHCRARYCSRFCQAMDWPVHRLTCSLPAVGMTLNTPPNTAQLGTAQQGMAQQGTAQAVAGLILLN